MSHSERAHLHLLAAEPLALALAATLIEPGSIEFAARSDEPTAANLAANFELGQLDAEDGREMDITEAEAGDDLLAIAYVQGYRDAARRKAGAA